MGSKSKSSQSQSTTNTNIQQSFTDNSRTDIWQDNSQRTDIWQDNSQRTDINQTYDLSRQNSGFMLENVSGSTINYAVTDAGAFDLAEAAGAAMRDVTIESLLTYKGVSGDALLNMADVTKYALAENSDVARDFGNYMAQSTMNQINNNSDLLRALSDDIRDTSGDAMNTVLDQTRYALQFADASTRSDGQQLAVATNKTMMIGIVVVGVLGVAFIAFKGKK